MAIATLEAALIYLINERVPSIVGCITPIFRNENASLPALTYETSLSSEDVDLDCMPSGIIRTTIDVDIWAKTYAEVKAIQKSLFNLNGYHGQVDEINIGFIQVSASGDDLDSEPDIQTSSLKFQVTTI
ncbi:hypothetical protein [Shewanella surugensis]|uniref:DUF3168 domain-containing protein n=1 Tax=Shewanella surugensis TaxID=212020 RepID=A0ABT0LGC5_9GAMM|nr:hypothetical protein [Shewanella surugensis]MCL1126710.1 hypothetical protein [Shewanella surugensis]